MKVATFPGLSQAECAELVALAADRVGPLPGRRRDQGWSWALDVLPAPAERVMYELAEVNAAHYRLDLRLIRFAVLRYEAGQRMGRHTDEYHPDGERRLLSCSVQLSPGDDYEGGDLLLGQFLETTADRAVGAAVAFPACVPHEVTEITAGVRWSLVGWCYGPA